jgi:hypothetical protein
MFRRLARIEERLEKLEDNLHWRKMSEECDALVGKAKAMGLAVGQLSFGDNPRYEICNKDLDVIYVGDYNSCRSFFKGLDSCKYVDRKSTKEEEADEGKRERNARNKRSDIG